MPVSQRAKTPIRLVLALGLTAAVSACDHSPERVGDNTRQVTVVGSGHVQGVPDTLTADVGIEFTARDVTAAMIQFHGGIGYTWEHDTHYYFKRAKRLEYSWGDAAEHRERIAHLVVDR